MKGYENMILHKLKYLLIISIILILLSPFSFAFYTGPDTTYVWSDNAVPTAVTDSNGNTDFLDLSCESAILIEQNSGNIIYEKNSHAKLRPASVTKIMTILLIMEALKDGKISYDTPITCSETASKMGGSQIWLEIRRNINC